MRGLYLGPIFRWYFVSGSKACQDLTANGGGNTFDSNQCKQDFSSFSIPDIVFVGAGATFRP